jgi:hypothetical protein
MTSRFRLRKASTAASPAKRNETPSRHFHARRLGPLKTAEHYRIKLAFDRADAAANRNLRFGKKLGAAEIIHMREDQVPPAAAPNGAAVAALGEDAAAGRRLAGGSHTAERDAGGECV